MKYLILPLLLVSVKGYSCSQKIDESKIMLFVDANFSDLEINTATKAACQRGEKLVVIPKTYKDYTPQIRKVEGALKKLNQCKNDCNSFVKEYTDAQETLANMNKIPVKDLIESELKNIRSKNGKLTNFIISGHNGGGSFGGYKGGVSREEISEIMNNFQDINDVSTLMLLGCYTGVQKEIGQWKGIFPKVRMIGGYDGSAPLSDKPMGHQYLEDLLTKEKSLLQQADEKQLNQYVKANIRGLHSMHSAVYLEPACAEGSEVDPMYYGSLTSRKFSSFDSNHCMSKAGEVNQIEFKFSKFNSGEIEPPKNPSDPAIKTLYDQARSLEHCIEILESPMNVNSLFNLRFYESVKENFATFYSDELKTAELILKDLDIESLSKSLDQDLLRIADLEKETLADNERLTNNPLAYFTELEEKVRQEENSYNSIISDPDKREILNKVQDPNYKATFQEEILFDEYTALKKSILSKRTKLIYRNDPDILININNFDTSAKRQQILSSKQSIKLLEDKKVWLPTLENLKKYSRKELRENIHNISGVLTVSSIPRKTRLALDWAVKAQSEHLLYFQNPFEWHEVTSRVTPPDNKITIGEKIPAPSTYSGGFGMGGGFSFTSDSRFGL